MGDNSSSLLVEKEKRDEHLQKACDDTHKRMVETAIAQLVDVFREFVKHWFCDKAPVDEGKLSSGERRVSMMDMRR